MFSKFLRLTSGICSMPPPPPFMHISGFAGDCLMVPYLAVRQIALQENKK